jgi:hypothetical protein
MSICSGQSRILSALGLYRANDLESIPPPQTLAVRIYATNPMCLTVNSVATQPSEFNIYELHLLIDTCLIRAFTPQPRSF